MASEKLVDGDFLSKLHDRQALEKRESRRRFLGGEGFVAWPGPALRDFIDSISGRLGAASSITSPGASLDSGRSTTG